MVRIDYSKQSNCNVLVAYGQAMAEPFSKYLIRILMRQIRNYILDIIPEKVRKIVGWILLIFGAVAMLGFWLGGLFFGLTDYEEISIITSIVGIFSIVLGIILLIHKDR
jgi:hypothetical protein